MVADFFSFPLESTKWWIAYFHFHWTRQNSEWLFSLVWWMAYFYFHWTGQHGEWFSFLSIGLDKMVDDFLYFHLIVMAGQYGGWLSFLSIGLDKMVNGFISIGLDNS